MKSTAIIFSFLLSLLINHKLIAQEKSKEVKPQSVETVKYPEKEKVTEMKNENKTTKTNPSEKITITEEGTESTKSINNNNTNHKPVKKGPSSFKLSKPVKIDVNEQKTDEKPKKQ